MKRGAPLYLALAILGAAPAIAHEGFQSREEVAHETAYWTGERFPDGRPKVADDILDKMKNVSEIKDLIQVLVEIDNAEGRLERIVIG